MRPKDANHENASTWSRRAVLGAALAVPAVVLPVAAAHAQRRTPVGIAPA